MPEEYVVVGPPGTGKTSFCIDASTEWFSSGVLPEQVAYLAFTKAAANEAVNRIGRADTGLPGDTHFPYFRTLHSLAYKGLHEAKKDLRVMTQSDLNLFAKWSGFQGTYSAGDWEDLSEVYASLRQHGRTDWDRCHTAYNLSRISSRSPGELAAARTGMSRFACKTIAGLEEDVYRAFVNKYEAYKLANGLVDFSDMLEFALNEMRQFDGVRYVVIDESQDLAPLSYLIIDRLFEHSEQIFWAGDADQAIYNFNAADAGLFLERARRPGVRRILLRTTHRFGDRIVRFARKIISRVADRIECDVIGVDGRSHTIKFTGSFEPAFQPDTMILHRHVMGCQALAAAFIAQELPFRNERGKDPLGAEKRMMAFETLEELASGREVSAGAVGRVLDELMPSVVLGGSEGMGKRRLVVHGGKKKIQTETLKQDLRLKDLVAAKILTEEGSEVISLRQFGVLKHSSDLEYYRRLREKGYDLRGKCPVITTLHGSKGREAKNVVLFTETSRKCWEDPESEHRLAYVGSTRTQGTLEICAERTVDWAEIPYEYPSEDKAGEGGTE